MGLIRKAQTTVAVLIFTAAGAGCFAQQEMNTQDPYNPQNQRLPNGPTNPNLNSSFPGTPSNVVPSLIDMGFGTDQGNIGPFVTPADKQFARMTAMRSMMEIQLSQAALEKASSDAVRQLAQRMLDDYTRWSDSIQRISARLDIQIPAELDARHKAETDQIMALSGAEFDRAYLREMVRLQNKALTITHYEAANAGVARFRNWAGVMIPTMQEELKIAKQEENAAALVSRK